MSAHALPPVDLSCSTICFRTSTLDEALAEIAGFGFSRVDLGAVSGFCEHFQAATGERHARAAVSAALRRHGLRASTVTCVPGHFNAPGARFEEIVRAGRNAVLLAAELGCHAVNFHCGMPLEDHAQFRHEAKAQATGLRELARFASDHAVGVNVEAPHRNGLCRTVEEAEWLLDRIADPAVRVVLDVSHVQASGVPPADLVRRWAGRIGHVHLRDAEADDVFRVPGEGAVDFGSVFEALDRSGYAGACALELEGHGDSIPDRRAGLRRALAALARTARFEPIVAATGSW